MSCVDVHQIKDSDLDYTNKDQLYQRIDELPGGAAWKCREIHQQGDLLDANGQPMSETFEIWYRDPIECIQELIGNPAFAEHLAYAPHRVYRDEYGQERHIDDMWTADWWWEIQVN